MRNAKGQFTDGPPRYPVGTIRVRTQHKRNHEQRNWIKIGEPNLWERYARYVWKKHHHRDIPPGYSIHHKDENSLNDDIDNLELVSKKEHMNRHRFRYADKVITNLIEKRKALRWSTKSKRETKKLGRHPKSCDCPIHKPPA